MNARRAAPWVIITLVIVGTIALSARTNLQQRKPLTPGDSFWELTYTISFNAQKAGAKIRAAFPADTAHSRVTQHKSGQGDVTLEKSRRARTETREIGLVAPRAGAFRVTGQFDIHLSPRSNWRVPDLAAPTAEARANFLKSDKGIQVDGPEVQKTLDELRRTPVGPFELLNRIFEHCVTGIGSGGRDSPTDADEALKRRHATALGRVRALVALCRAAKLPARIVTGFEIHQEPELRPRYWAEVFIDNRWEPYDPENGFSRELPHNYLPVRRDGFAIVHAVDCTDLRPSYALARVTPPSHFHAENPRLIDVLDLTRLPLEMQRAFAVILLMPLGALVTSIFRTIIGLRTFGTFTPTLLALAFVYNDWRSGVAIFIVVLLLGLVSRRILEPLKLLLVPRLSIILTFVVMSMLLAVSAIDYFDWTQSSDAVLLPMVILTGTVERFYLTSEEDSSLFALELLGGTSLVAVFCYLILRWDRVGQFLLHFPEAHFFTVAVLVMLGRYSGYRLTELWRFRDLAGRPPE